MCQEPSGKSVGISTASSAKETDGIAVSEDIASVSAVSKLGCA
jgi:hypothetical protein